MISKLGLRTVGSTIAVTIVAGCAPLPPTIPIVTPIDKKLAGSFEDYQIYAMCAGFWLVLDEYPDMSWQQTSIGTRWQRFRLWSTELYTGNIAFYSRDVPAQVDFEIEAARQLYIPMLQGRPDNIEAYSIYRREELICDSIQPPVGKRG